MIAPQGKVASPVDGAVSQAGKIDEGKMIQAKGHSYSVEDLLGGDESLADTFKNGSFANIYLSPGDYHHFHMPMNGTLLKMIHVPGKRYSVSPKAARNIDGLFLKMNDWFVSSTRHKGEWQWSWWGQSMCPVLRRYGKKA